LEVSVNGFVMPKYHKSISALYAMEYGSMTVWHIDGIKYPVFHIMPGYSLYLPCKAIQGHYGRFYGGFFIVGKFSGY
jgi:hypothetical protein